MTAAAIASHTGPWTEEEFLALGETPDRIELFDGSLFVSPAPILRHQMTSYRLVTMLEDAAAEHGLLVFQAVNLRLRPDRIPIPDLVITDEIDLDELLVPAEKVRLVCEILSRHNRSTDRVLKMHYYATAQIPWYLLVEQDPVALSLYRLDGDTYREHAVAEFGQVLSLTEPIVAEIDTKALAVMR